MNIKPIKIDTPKGTRLIGPGQPTFIVAEISCNHQQNYAEAVRLVKAAAKAGADAVKFQTYTPDTITLNCDNPLFVIGGKDNPDSWQKLTFYSIYQKGYTPWEWLPKLKKLAKSLGLVFFTSVFDETAVDFNEKMGVPLYKVAAYEATHVPLLKKIASTGKPVIISIGFASQKESQEAVETLRKAGAKEIAVLHCLTSYAATPNSSTTHLATIRDIENRFNVISGLSDNNGGIELPVMAVLSGGHIVEKHLNMRHGNKSFDDRFSIDPKELAMMVKKIREAEKFLGTVHYGPNNDAEKHNRNFRRSIFVSQAIKKGQKFTRQNIKVVRPAYGLHTKYFDKVLGKVASTDIQFGDPLKFAHVVDLKK
ncbi:MAG: pseudaminic acid synthase [Candidatus Yanofskybacteria bacterium]|nr:pseudaminic acid synthase [Candidatus Yanofskybacteria bacterium]